ncbi:nucleotidyl transferase family protein, partial [Chlamydia psittaci 84-8471/1]
DRSVSYLYFTTAPHEDLFLPRCTSRSDTSPCS